MIGLWIHSRGDAAPLVSIVPGDPQAGIGVLELALLSLPARRNPAG